MNPPSANRGAAGENILFCNAALPDVVAFLVAEGASFGAK